MDLYATPPSPQQASANKKKPVVGFMSAALITLGTSFLTWETAKADLSYEAYIDSDKRIKCLYGYAADKTGDHAAAIKIFEDCINRWEDVYSMIWLAQIYEAGVAVPQDLAYSTALMKRGAHANDAAGYSSIARYHYGVALYEGIGTDQDKQEGLYWLKQAADEGVAEAAGYLQQQGH
ncbi:tetratricopeptide repeat protein [Oceanospirillum sanctuarii]|uniref:tetratricopeptide repeat protein n=1 Tax=Oceanospirillum sanctuarii TaxID=1434821 RepID=UPI001C3E54B3|nr:SEL1-like repeat protein [Oceanospirillum sanctuarii]